MNIGSGWSGQTEETKKQYISLSLDKTILALFPFLKNFKFTLWYVPKDERKDPEKSPSWTLSMGEPYKKEEKEAATSTNDTTFSDEEILF